MPDERWRPVPPYRLLGIPAGYEASSLGNVRGPSGRLLALRADRDDYETAKVGGRLRRVSILVQLAFAGPPEVRHLDGNRRNNQPQNLEWGSRWRNEQDKKEGKDEIGGKVVTVPSRPVTSGTGGRGGL